MNLIELNRALRQLRLGGMAAVLETRLQQAQAEPMVPIDFLSCLVSDELTRRGDRLLERRRKQAQFRDPQVSFDNFDFDFNKRMNRSLVFDLATAAFVARHDDALFLGPPGTGKSHLAQAIGKAVIGQGYRVIYREAHSLRVGDLKLEHGVIEVRRAVWNGMEGETKTKAGKRNVFLDSVTVNLLRDYLAGRQSGRLFQS